MKNGFYLDKFSAGDKADFIEHFKEREIFEHTLAIPFPYTNSDADFWINKCLKEYAEQAQVVNFAVRTPEGRMVGGCGYHDFVAATSHRAELGYWLAKPFWGQGIMTLVVQELCRIAFEELNLVKVTAGVFSFNSRSARVLEKCGFEKEAVLKKHYCKDGQYIDAIIFSKFKS